MRSVLGLRTRWAAIGAACAVALGGGALGVVNATVSTGDRASYFPINPTRVLDTRNSSEITNATLRLSVEGLINVVGETNPRTVVPTDATAVAINLTVTAGRKNGSYGFVTAFPCISGSDSAPNASSLNFENGIDVANALNVTTSANGSICLYVYGSADLIVDVAGYYASHDHDDRYYTEAETNTLLDENADETAGRFVPGAPQNPSTAPVSERGLNMSSTLGAHGDPVLAFLNFSNSLKLAICDDSHCSSAVVKSLTGAGPVGGGSLDIAISSEGFPIVSFFDSVNLNGDLKLIVCRDTNCSSFVTRTLDSNGEVGFYSSVAVGADGNPVVAYYDWTNGDLKVAICSNATCSSNTTERLDSTGDVGLYPSLGIAVTGHPVISYYDSTGQNLKVAACSTPTCASATISTIDSNYDVGRIPSLSIGVDGNPIIAYSGSINSQGTHSLKVASCTNPTCTSATISAVDENFRVYYISSAVDRNGNLIISYKHDRDGIKIAVCINPQCTSANLTIVGSGFETTTTIGIDGTPLIFHSGAYEINVLRAWWVVGGR